MKVTTVIDPTREEEIIIYVKKESPLADAIEKLAREGEKELVGYKDSCSYILDPAEILYFSTEGSRVTATTQEGSFTLKTRLYALEEELPKNFIKINKSCIANIKMISRFDSSFSGTLIVIFKNGNRDYVSRRNIKKVKERLGL